MAELRLDWNKVDQARTAAAEIALDTEETLSGFTTVTVERSIARLFGVDSVDEHDVPFSNRLIEVLQEKDLLGHGAAYYIGRAAVGQDLEPQEFAELVACGELDPARLKPVDRFELKLWIDEAAARSMARIRLNRLQREERLEHYGEHGGPLLYVIVATGNIYEDIVQAQAAVKQGADIIAVIRSTGQSLLDYVPYGATTEGFGGTLATQENFRLMRAALDEAGAEVGRYIRLCNYCSGLCMPEIAVMGALERLDVMLNDALYGILFRDINMQRTLIDQSFSRMINGAAGIIINTGEDNYLTTSDAFEEAHTVLASQFINEQFAKRAGMPEELMGLGHAFEMDPALPNSFVYELAQAQMARQIFPHAPLKYMPPTKFKCGNIFQSQVQDTLFNMVSVLSKQNIHLLGMITEAIHTPFMSDRALALENARYVARSMSALSDEVEIKEGGLMEQRADVVLDKAVQLLQNIQTEGMFQTLAEGKFAGIRRDPDGGKGLDGVIYQEEGYYNPFIELCLDEEAEILAAFMEKRKEAGNE
ncbi:MAG: lysine 5,6-aminomutase subunit alpha [Eubacteriales bacterium]|nr:lysine 5,6-aminomutase subunit alpha [Eubacteriales bacterium]MDD4323566.1 lysine 5,6-aminomutase subunit alpha [Eubacteriales bacterium]MDD4541093.1 lysine 5,6-aminomutase subunit alpha [Eubacteriales bacterium]